MANKQKKPSEPSEPAEPAAIISNEHEPRHVRVPLSDFTHRNALQNGTIAVAERKDAVTEPTVAQRERLVFLADDALEVLEAAMESPDESMRLKAAENVLDRAGLGRNNRTEHVSNAADIPAEALVQVISGLSAMFGNNSKLTTPNVPNVRNVSPETASPNAINVPCMLGSGGNRMPEALLNRHKDRKGV